MILVDTNLLGRMTDSTDLQCEVARRAIRTLLIKHERLIIATRAPSSSPVECFGVRSPAVISVAVCAEEEGGLNGPGY
jgi:hypothetical protein